MFKKVCYYLRLLSVFFFIVFICLLLEVILSCGGVGISFLVMASLFVFINLFTILSRKKVYQDLVSYNLVSIALSLYIGIITTRYFIDYRATSLAYQLNYGYFKTNFIIIDLVVFGIALNSLFIYFITKEKSH